MDTTNWKWFRYDEIFDIKHGFYNKKPEDNPLGDIPFIGATDSNNGITSYSDMDTISVTTKTGDGNNAPIEEKIFSNCIAVTNNGSVGYAYYQEQPFTCTHDVNPLYLKDKELNKYIALFLCTIIEKERFRWAYGRKWRPTRMPSSRMKLPVTANGTPDWQYIEDYVKNTIIPQLPEQARAVSEGKYDISPARNNSINLKHTKWANFKIGDIFNIQRGHTLTSEQKDLIGDIPCVNGSTENNRILCYLSESLLDEGFILQSVPSLSLCRVGTSGATFVQNKPYFIADNAFSLRTKEEHSISVYVFLSTILDQECIKYSYGRTISSVKYMETVVSLPAIANPDGTYSPDWQFMEDYIKSLPYSKNI